MFDAAAQSIDLRVVHAFLAKSKEDKPATTFSRRCAEYLVNLEKRRTFRSAMKFA